MHSSECCHYVEILYPIWSVVTEDTWLSSWVLQSKFPCCRQHMLPEQHNAGTAFHTRIPWAPGRPLPGHCSGRAIKEAGTRGTYMYKTIKRAAQKICRHLQ